MLPEKKKREKGRKEMYEGVRAEKNAGKLFL
jgi:hypothetical protein